MPLQYRNVRQLNQCIVDNLHRIPADVSIIAGVPRSGMVPAVKLALYLDLPLTDLDGLLEGRVMRGGDRTRHIPDSEKHRALIVDDAIFTGSQFGQVRAQVEAAGLELEVLYCCIYARPDKAHEVDLYFEELPGDKWLFEWNKFNHGIVPSMCVDMDGVLCRDPLPEEDDDGERYRTFIKSAEAKFRPRRKLGWIVTSRLEKYRAETEAWLAQHRIEYGELLMMDLPTLQDRTPGKAIAHKAKVYSETPSSLFVESTLGQSHEICRLTGRPVLCTQNGELITPSGPRQLSGRLDRVWRRLWRRLSKPAR